MHLQTDVLIVGAGVGGASLALALGKKGYHVTIIDRLKDFPHIYKGEFLQPVTLDLLDQFGLVDEISKHCVRVTKMSYGFIGGIKCITALYNELNIPFKYGLNGSHRKIHEIIMNEALRYPNISFHPGVVAKKVVYDGSKVVGVQAEGPEGPLTISSKILVGADGVHSMIRKQLQVNYNLYPFEEKKARICAFTIQLQESSGDEVTFYFGSSSGCGVFPLPNHQIRVYLAVRNEMWEKMRAKGVQELKELAQQFYPDLRENFDQLTDMKQVQVIPCYHLHTEKWAVDGAVLLGDACHSVSPALGQGMNLAIQGAMELSKTIDKALKLNRVDEAILREYERNRRRFVRVIQQTSNVHTFCWLTGNKTIQSVRNRLFRKIGKCPSIMQTQLQIVAGYRSKHPPFIQLLRLFGILHAQ